MTLAELFSKFKVEALKNPLVKTVVESPDAMEYTKDLKYGVFTIEGGVITIDKGYLTWNGGLYYINRLIDNPSDSTEKRKEDQAYDIQSQGVDVLYNMVYSIPEIAVVSVTFQPFTHKFLDYCAGVIANVTIKIPYVRQNCVDSFVE